MTRLSSSGLPLALTFALALVGCGDATGILIDVTSSDLTAPADIDTLRFEVTSNSGRTVDETFSLPGPLPQSLTIARVGADDTEVVIRVTGTKDGAFVVRRVVRTTFEPGFTRRIEVALYAACEGVMCQGDLDCVTGACEGQPPLDGGVDAGPDEDAGMVDAGPPSDDAGSDAGPIDAGMMDAGPPGTDAGPDAGPPPVDAGMDAGPDAGPVLLTCLDTPAACDGVVVLSELAPAGSGGPSDEFIELHNASAAPVDIGGLRLEYSAHMAISPSLRAVIPMDTILPPGGFFLLGSVGYVGPAPDMAGAWANGFSATRGAILLSAGSTVVDLLGWHGGNELPRSEGTPVDPPSDFDADESFERRANAASTSTTMSSGGSDHLAGNGFDSGNNVADWIVRSASEPQSSSSTPEP